MNEYVAGLLLLAGLIGFMVAGVAALAYALHDSDGWDR